CGQIYHMIDLSTFSMKLFHNPKTLVLVFLLIGISFFVYAFNLSNPLFWDDVEWILENRFVHDFGQIKEIFTGNVLTGFGLTSDYYRPFLMLTFAFNYVLGGENPIGYHLINNGLHIANGLLIFLFFRRFIGQPASFIAALLFLIHPLQTEAVTYIAGRGDPLSVFFMLLAIWLFNHMFRSSTSKQGSWFLIGSLAVMILALLSRETAILLPFLLVLFYMAFLSNGKFINSLKDGLIKTWPYFTISAVYFVLRLTVLNFKDTLNFYSQANFYTEHLSYRLYTFGAVLFEYFKLILVPVGLHMEREMAVRTSIFQWPVWPAIGIVLCIMYFVLWFYKKDLKILNTQYTIHNTDYRIWFFGWSWFFIGLAPVSGILPINAVMYEHWLYLPLVGLFILAGFYLDKLFGFLKENHRFLFVICVLLFGVYISFYAVQNVKRNVLWGDPIKFYEDILRYNPTSLRVINNLANQYYLEKNFEKAEEYYKKSIENESGIRFAQPYYNLGNTYRERGGLDTAIEYYNKAIEADPNFPFSYHSLAVIYAGQGELKKASDILEEVKKIRPDNPRVYYNLGLIYAAQGNKKLAIENLETGLQYVGIDVEAETQIKDVLSKLRNPNIKIEN
ncbi:MAG: tetratricopeptide repeat protein, partial [Candidatus Taylorbacteria bacterium]|nr:tetratricopeptide repeat protein [Candidatus Taylorbacteria bacterium]